MPPKIDPDATPGVKLLRLFRKLMLDGRRHFQADLAEEFQCSPQTIIRLACEIEAVIGASLETGVDNRRKWYQIKSISRSHLGLQFEELRYLSVCRDLAAASLPNQVSKRVDATIMQLSVLMADRDYAEREDVQKPQYAFFSKGKIDYTPHYVNIEKLVRAAEEQRICLVSYKAAGKAEAKEHRFAPKRLASMNGALYALGGDLTENFRELLHLANLAVHRIQEVTLLERKCMVALPDAEAGAFGLPWHEPRIFSVRFRPGKAADYVRERIWADEQKLVEMDDGGVLLTMTTRSEPELMAWVRSFGDEASLAPN